MVGNEDAIPEKYRIHHNLMRYLRYYPAIYFLGFFIIQGVYMAISGLLLGTFLVVLYWNDLKFHRFGFNRKSYSGLYRTSFAFLLIMIQILSETLGVISIFGTLELFSFKEVYYLKNLTIFSIIFMFYIFIFSSHIFFNHFKGQMFDTKKYLSSKHEKIGRYIYLHRFQTISLFYIIIVELIGKIHYWFSILILAILTVYYVIRPERIDKYLRPNKEYHLFLFFLALIITIPFATVHAARMTPWWYLTGIGKLLSILMLFNSAVMLIGAFHLSVNDFFARGKKDDGK